MEEKIILIIDDEPIIARVLTRILQKNIPGLIVVCLSNPGDTTFKQTLATRLQTVKVDLIISDIELRYDTTVDSGDGRRLSTSKFEIGYEVIADHVDTVPCIVMSGSRAALDFEDPFARFAYLRPKIRTFFHKPFPSEDALIAAVKAALSSPADLSENPLQ